MSSDPGGAEPQWSQDRAWYWDGSKWVPASQAPEPPPAGITPPPPPPAAPTMLPTPDPAPIRTAARAGGVPSWLAIVGLVLCFPVGIVLALLTHWSGRAKAIAIAVVLVLYVGTGIGIASSGQHSTQTPNVGQSSPVANEAHASPSQPQVSTPSPSPSPKPHFATFGDGTFQVGTDIKPGVYRTRDGDSGCYFARLKGFSGSLDDIIANENTDSPAVVMIAATDKGFQSDGCGTWTTDLSPITSSKTAFDDGDFIVGVDLVGGTYKSSGEQGCYYARLRGFGHTFDDIIANANTDSPAIVTIAATDKGFESSGCGHWTKIG